MVRAGTLRHRLDVESSTSIANEFGEPDVKWVKLATVWGEIEPVGGREVLIDGQVKAEVTHRIKVRGGISLTSRNRFKFKGRVFNIEHIGNRGELGEAFEVLCKEVAA